MALLIATYNPVDHSESMTNELMREVDDPPQRTPTLPLPSELPYHLMSASELADHCLSEINNYLNGKPSNDQYGLELFHRALMQRDALAWEIIQQRFKEVVFRWMLGHPLRKVACRYDSEENYVAQAFARFWQATAGNQEIRFRTLAAVLRYLRASLHGAILDTLRAYSRPQEVPLPEPGEPGEPLAKDQDVSPELWEVILSLISDKRQQRVAYLLFHCHLKPREIIQFCPEEFSNIQEIYRLRRTIVERLLRNADYLRWRLNNYLQ
jgi:hypothetical protein